MRLNLRPTERLGVNQMRKEKRWVGKSLSRQRAILSNEQKQSVGSKHRKCQGIAEGLPDEVLKRKLKRQKQSTGPNLQQQKH